MKWKLSFSLVMIAAIALLGSCSNDAPSPIEPVTLEPVGEPVDTVPLEDVGPLEHFPGSLREGERIEELIERPAMAEVVELDSARVRALLERLDPLPTDVDDVQPFALRPDSDPPPRTGVTEVGEFPTEAERQLPEHEAPEDPPNLLRHAPEGEVPIAGQVSLTFDRPMVAVTAHDDLVAEQLPIRIEPDVQGAWRWIGTRTLVFEPDAPRLPMATRFDVRVDPELSAADGQTLGREFRWQFQTPALELVSAYPTGTGVNLEPVILLSFNQRVEPESLLESLSILDGEGDDLAYRLADDDEIAADASVARQVESMNPGTWLAIRPLEPLPGNTRITLELEAGAASAEGWLLTTEAQRRTFHTYGPLIVRSMRCGGWQRDCAPTDVFVLEFSNTLSSEQDLAELIHIEPEIPGVDIRFHDHLLTISGLKRGQTTYTVELDEAIVDRFGQNLTGLREFQFDVGSFPARLSRSADALTTLDPYGPPKFDFFTTNLANVEVRIHRVDPSQWGEYMEVMRGHRPWSEKTPELPGEPVYSDTFEISAERDVLHRSALDLEPWLDGGHGHLLVLLTAGKPLVDVHDEQRTQTQLTWVQATPIGIDAMDDHDTLLVWASQLTDGRALENAEVRVAGMDGQWQTGVDGLALIELVDRNEMESGPHWVTVRVDGETALLPESGHGWSRTGWHRQSRTDQLIWQVFDDRRTYRPGEQVHLKGWIRHMEQHPDGGLGLPREGGQVRYQVMDARGNEFHSGEVEVGRLGGFDLAFDVPDVPNLGTARVQFEYAETRGLDNTRHSHSFSIQEFRTPEFEVDTRVGEGPFFGDQAVEFEVEAAYYAGGALPGADTTWQVQAQPGRYSPPGRDDWSFGIPPDEWIPRPRMEGGVLLFEALEGMTDSAGRHTVTLQPDFEAQPRPLVFTALATVMDVNRQAWTASSNVLVHPGEVYVGLRTDAYFVDRGEPLVVDVITTDIDGEPAGDSPVKVELTRLGHHWGIGRSSPAGEVVSRCQIVSDADGTGQCTFTPELGGQYRVMAMTEDGRGRANATRIQRWVGGGRMAASERVEREPVKMIADQDYYTPGQTARLLIQAPFEAGEGLLTLRRHGLAEQHRFSFSEGSTTLDIELREEWLPNVHAHVLLIGESERGDVENVDPLPSRPAIATGSHELNISTAERSLDIDLAPQDHALAPGESTEIDMRVLDADGQPVADTEIALVVVDEAILALGNYRIPDPLEIFYRSRPVEVRDHHLRPSIRLLTADDLLTMAKSMDAMMVDEAVREVSADYARPAAPETLDAIDVRKDFNPLAAFEPALITDGEGRVSARIDLPDNLTRYRITAVAVSGASHYGKSETTLTARLPLMVRPSPPRFLNFGDRFEFPVVLQNQTDQDQSVDVAMDVANLDLTGAQGYRLDIPANDRVEVRFPAETRKSGTARFQMAVAGNEFSDAARGELPVWTPATREAFATYGQLDEGGIVQPVIMPEAVWPQFGQLEITTSSTAVQSLTDAFIHLHDYPYRSSEAMASRILAIVALRDILEAFEADGLPKAEDVDQTMEDDLQQLASLQNPDGGFGLWRRGQDSWPYPSLHVAHALVRARLEQYTVDDGLYDRTMDYVRDIERHIPTRYGQRTRDHILAYALHVRALEGDSDRSQARALVNRTESLESLSFESLGWLLGMLGGDENSTDERDRLRRFLANRVTETAAGASFASAFQDGDHLIMHSSRRADGIILEALMSDDPDSDLIPKLVHDLQAHRVRGHWSSTQDNAFVLLALKRYFETYEAVEPDFVARTWLGQEFAGEHPFKGRTTERHHIDIPMQWLADRDEQQDLTLVRDGAGRMYYRIGLRYAPKSLDLEPASHGFEVSREYRPVERDEDVELKDDGTWEIRAGARVKVELTLVAPARRHHVALVDAIPAGLEPLNPALAVSDVPDNGSPDHPVPHGRMVWWGPWYQHQNLRDERVEAFAALLPGGVYQYRYYARATTPGEFIVPPARAEEMYQPETFGRSGSTRVVVVP